MAGLARLTRRSEFLRVADGRRKCVTPGVIVQAREAAEGTAPSPPARVGFTASKKVGGAVVRNRAKRRLRAIADEIMTRHALGGRDYVLIARPATVTRPFDALRADLESALRRLGSWTVEAGPC